MRYPGYLMLCAMILPLAACEQMNEMPKNGTLISPEKPAQAPEAIGSRPPAVSDGSIAGAGFANESGKALNRQDREMMKASTQHALNTSPAGFKTIWKNPSSGHSGTVTPQRKYTNRQGEACREFHETVLAGGRMGTGYGAACRQLDGVWKVVGK